MAPDLAGGINDGSGASLCENGLRFWWYRIPP